MSREEPSLYGEIPDIYDELYPKNWTAEEDVNFLETIFEEFGLQIDSILDFASGTGRHVDILSNEYEAFGTDISSSMVDYAKKNRDGKYEVQDMKNLDFSETVDVAFTFYSSISHLNTDWELREAFKALKNNVREGGLLIFDNEYRFTGMDEEENRVHFPVDHKKGRKEFFAYMDIRLEDYGFTQNCDHTYFVSRDGGENFERYDASFELNMLRPQKARELLEREGFKLEGIKMDRTMEEYEEEKYPETVSFIARNKS